MWALTFPEDDLIITGADATAVLRQLRKQQWDPDSRRRIKRALAWRTWVLTREPLDEELDDTDFLIRFAELNMARLEVSTDEGTVRFGNR